MLETLIKDIDDSKKHCFASNIFAILSDNSGYVRTRYEETHFCP